MKRKLSIIFGIVVFIPLVFSLVIISSLVSDRIEIMLEQKADDTLYVASNFFSDMFESLMLKARIISQIKDVQTAAIAKDPLELIDKIRLIRRDLNINFYDGIVEVYDNTGKLIAAEPKRPDKLAEPESIQAALTGSMKKNVKFFGDNLKFSAAVPMYNQDAGADSMPVGVIAISMVVSDKIADEIKKLTSAEIILFRDTKKENYDILSSSFIVSGERAAPQITRDSGNTMLLSNVSFGGNQYIIKFKAPENELAAANGSYFFAVALEKSQMLLTISSLQKNLYSIGIFSFAVALLLAIVFSRKITEPILALVENARIVGEGNLENEVRIDSDDELQDLGKMFDSMRLKIKDTIEELRSANSSLDKQVFNLSVMDRINQAIIQSRGNTLLKEVLQIIVEASKAERSSIMLLDEQTSRLALKTVYSKNPDSTQKIKSYVTLESGEGIAGKVLESGTAKLCNTPAEDSDFKQYDTTDVAPVSNLMCVPLKSDTAILGVINTVNKEGGFSADDLALLQKIAHQAAIALQNARLYELAITDGMTKLYIHRYFQARLEEELMRAKRFKKIVSLIMFDIDHFKKFNDTYGHQLGDVVIKKVAEILKKNVREEIDIPARYGGEEFAVIMPETTIDGAFAFAERLRKHIESTEIPHGEEMLKVTISLGCSEFPKHADTRENLIKKADEALYQSKEKGRNCTSVAT